ncbi:MAG: TolC family protein [Vicinamibacterales bacterium]
MSRQWWPAPVRPGRGLVAVVLATAFLGPASPLAAQTPAPMPAPAASAQDLPPISTVPAEAVTFDEAITRALAANLSVAQAAQSILRAEALLQQANTVTKPTVGGTVTTTILDSERGFDDLVTQPQTQALFGASVSYPVLAASRWAARAQASDQVTVARIGADDVRRQVATAAAQSYLAVIAQKRQVGVNLRALENAEAHLKDATAQLDAGAGSRLNQLRASQAYESDRVLLEGSRMALVRAQEALGVLLAADKPIDSAGEPAFEVPADPAIEQSLGERTDVQLFRASLDAAERVVADSWKDWVPTGTASFEPQYLTPAGLFQPSKTWRGVIQFQVPVFDGGQRKAVAAQRQVARDTAELQLTEVQLRARSEIRVAEAAVASAARAVESARRASQQANEVVRITEFAFRAGATTNLEVIDAQRSALDAETAAAQAEDRLRQARLDLLVALGRFPR